MRFGIETEKERKIKKSKIYKRKIYTIVILAASLLLIIIVVFFVSANSKQKAPINDTNSNEKLPQTPTTSPENIKKKEINIVDENSTERPIAVMIDNYIGGELHAGLQDSYLNYEIPIEGGITRIMAIYKDKAPSLIGPVRSARNYFLDYAIESDAIYTHYGWSLYKENDIEKLGIINIDGEEVSEVFRRDSNATSPHNVFTRMSYLRQYIDKTSINGESNQWKLLDYSTTSITLTNVGYVPKNATKINIPYSEKENRSYIYNEDEKYYMRYNNNKEQLDRKTGNQLHYKNIIVERVPIKVKNNKGELEVTTMGEGKAYYITNGKFLPIIWTKSSRSAKTKYTYANGKDVEFNDGNTFIQIVPEECNITIE